MDKTEDTSKLPAAVDTDDIIELTGHSLALSEWEKFVKMMQVAFPDFPEKPVQSFAYWLYKKSGLIHPVK